MASVKVENQGAFGSKRSRNAVREGDWTCPQCGNVNFSFRNVCNRGACAAPRPSPSPTPRMLPPHMTSGFERPPLLYGGAGTPPHIALGSGTYGSLYPHVGIRYGYGPPVGAPSSYGLFSSYGQHVGAPGGISYVPGLELGRLAYGYRGSPMPVLSPFRGALADNNDNTALRKRRGGPDGLSEGDWVCPKCENVNFAFRNTCNMKKCGAPRPTNGPNGGSSSRNNDKPEAPEGSWKCIKCNNVNYPFRTVCNRKGCGSERPDSASN